MMTSGTSLRIWRQQRGLSVEEMARLLDTTRATIYRWEQDEIPLKGHTRVLWQLLMHPVYGAIVLQGLHDIRRQAQAEELSLYAK